jgi:hypothetical protein
MMITYGIVSSKHYLEILEYLDDLELLESLDLIIELPSEGIRCNDELIATQINFEKMRNADITTILIVVTVTAQEQTSLKVAEQHTMTEIRRCDGLLFLYPWTSKRS